jgi:hypothetical protein
MRRWLQVLLLLAFVAVMGCSFLSPIRKPADEIRSALLREKPLGTQIEEVQRWLATEKGLNVKKAETGYFTPRGQTVGLRSLSTSLGEYLSYGVLATSVEAFWAFDQSGALVDVWVRKSVDAP